MEYLGIQWSIFSYVHSIAELLLMGYVLYRFVRPFMESRKGAACSGAVYSAVIAILYWLHIIDFFLIYILGVFAAFLVMSWADRKNYEQKCFLAVTFFSLRWLTSAMAEILYDNLYSYAENTDYILAHPDMDFALYIGVCVFYLALEFAFIAAAIWCILNAYVYKHAVMGKKELFMLISPSVMGFFAYLVMEYYRAYYIVAENGRISSVYDSLALLYYAVSVIAIIVVIVLYQGIKAGQEEKLQNELLAAQVESLQYHIGRVENLYQNIRSVKHDMANHILTLERLYEGNQIGAAKAYSEDLKTELAQVTDGMKSGNPVTDVILQEFQKDAGKKEILFQSEFHYPVDSDINVFDISVILNNALQNAIENTGKEKIKQISIVSYRKNNAYIIEICNSFTGNIQWDAESGLPVTSKEKTDSHGYGLSNIRRVARKYAGDIDIVLKDGEFCLCILLMTE